MSRVILTTWVALPWEGATELDTAPSIPMRVRIPWQAASEVDTAATIPIATPEVPPVPVPVHHGRTGYEPEPPRPPTKRIPFVSATERDRAGDFRLVALPVQPSEEALVALGLV